MQICAPFGTIRDVIHDSLKGDKFSRAAFACAATQFHLCDDAFGDVHFMIISETARSSFAFWEKKNLLNVQEILDQQRAQCFCQQSPIVGGNHLDQSIPDAVIRDFIGKPTRSREHNQRTVCPQTFFDILL